MQSVHAFVTQYLRGLGDAYRLTLWASLLAAALAVGLPGWPLRRATSREAAQDRVAALQAEAA